MCKNLDLLRLGHDFDESLGVGPVKDDGFRPSKDRPGLTASEWNEIYRGMEVRVHLRRCPTCRLENPKLPLYRMPPVFKRMMKNLPKFPKEA